MKLAAPSATSFCDVQHQPQEASYEFLLVALRDSRAASAVNRRPARKQACNGTMPTIVNHRKAELQNQHASSTEEHSHDENTQFNRLVDESISSASSWPCTHTTCDCPGRRRELGIVLGKYVGRRKLQSVDLQHFGR